MDDIQIADIPKELAKLHEAQIDKKEIRASLFTLIIYTHEEERSQYLREIVQNIIEKFPCRIIFIAADRTPGSSHMRVGVSSAVNTKGGAVVACDQITIEVGVKYLNRVPYLLLPHLLTDLPVYLLWGQDPTSDNEILPTLEKLADRLIFDAECTKNLKKFTDTILLKSKTLHLGLMDINWALVNGWRDLLLHVFYTLDHLDQLRKSSAITIVYNQVESNWIHQPEMQAIYLEAWLACRLGWEFKSMVSHEGCRIFTYAGSHGNVVIKLVPQRLPSLPSGGISSIDIVTADSYHFLLTRELNHSKVTVNCSSCVMCELPFSLPLPDIKRGYTFMNEIFYSIPSRHYIDVLELLNKMDWT